MGYARHSSSSTSGLVNACALTLPAKAFLATLVPGFPVVGPGVVDFDVGTVVLENARFQGYTERLTFKRSKEEKEEPPRADDARADGDAVSEEEIESAEPPPPKTPKPKKRRGTCLIS